MADKRLVEYIKNTLLRGHRLEDIKKHLIAHGYSKKDIDKAVDHIHRLFDKNKVSSKKDLF